MKLTGNAFWLKVRNNSGQVAELWNLRPDFMTVVTDPEHFIKGYKLRKMDGTEVNIPAEDIVHIKYPDPTSPYVGMSPLKPVQVRVQTEEWRAKSEERE
jgi:phage portal protein BeeE